MEWAGRAQTETEQGTQHGIRSIEPEQGTTWNQTHLKKDTACDPGADQGVCPEPVLRAWGPFTSQPSLLCPGFLRLCDLRSPPVRTFTRLQSHPPYAPRLSQTQITDHFVPDVTQAELFTG